MLCVGYVLCVACCALFVVWCVLWVDGVLCFVSRVCVCVFVCAPSGCYQFRVVCVYGLAGVSYLRVGCCVVCVGCYVLCVVGCECVTCACVLCDVCCVFCVVCSACAVFVCACLYVCACR